MELEKIISSISKLQNIQTEAYKDDNIEVLCSCSYKLNLFKRWKQKYFDKNRIKYICLNKDGNEGTIYENNKLKMIDKYNYKFQLTSLPYFMLELYFQNCMSVREMYQFIFSFKDFEDYQGFINGLNELAKKYDKKLYFEFFDSRYLYQKMSMEEHILKYGY